MTSVTVAGAAPYSGGAGIVKRVSTAARVASTRDRWLRYGIAVSIAGLLAADAGALVHSLSDGARAQAPRSEAHAARIATPTPAPAQSVMFADSPSSVVPFHLAMPVAAAPVPAATASAVQAAAQPVSAPHMFAPPAARANPSAPRTGGSTMKPPPPPIAPAAPVVDAVEQAPVAGPALAPVIDKVVDTVAPIAAAAPVPTLVAPAVEAATPVVEAVAPVTNALVPAAAPVG